MPSKLSKEEVLADLQETNRKVDGSLTMQEYNEKGKYSSWSIQDKFGSFNKAKKELDLDTRQKGFTKNGTPFYELNTGYSKDELATAINRFLEDTDKPVTFPNLAEFMNVDQGSLKKYFSDKSNIKTRFDSLYDALAYIGFDLENIFDAWEKVILENSLYGWHNYKDFREKVSKESRFYFVKSSAHRDWGPGDFFEYVTEKSSNGLKVTRGSNGGATNKIYIKNSNVDRFSKYKEDLPDVDNAEEVFQECISHGQRPNSAVATINYLVSDSTQKEVSSEFGCSTMSIRNVRDYIVDEGLDERL